MSNVFTTEFEIVKNSLGMDITIFKVKSYNLTVAETRYANLAKLIAQALNDREKQNPLFWEEEIN